MAKNFVIYRALCGQMELEKNQFVYYVHVGLDDCLSFKRWDFNCEFDWLEIFWLFIIW